MILHNMPYGDTSLTRHTTQSRSFWKWSSQPITWLILTNKTVQENTQTKYNSKSKQVNNAKMQQNKTTTINYSGSKNNFFD